MTTRPALTTYIALLRGINVNGHRRIKMADLRACLEGDNADDSFVTPVRTWIQTGNVIFQSPRSTTTELEVKMQALISQEFGFDDVPVMIRTVEELQGILSPSNHPFADQESKRVFVAFLDQSPSAERVAAMQRINYQPEAYVIDRRNIHFFIPNLARYKLDTTLFEKMLQVHATSRNVRTLHKLLAIASEMSTLVDDDDAKDANKDCEEVLGRRSPASSSSVSIPRRVSKRRKR